MPGLEKTYRTELVTHLYRMHGFTVPGQPLNIEALALLHEDLHLDDYMCPPHKHKPQEDAFVMGKIKLLLGERYLENLVRRYR